MLDRDEQRIGQAELGRLDPLAQPAHPHGRELRQPQLAAFAAHAQHGVPLFGGEVLHVRASRLRAAESVQEQEAEQGAITERGQASGSPLGSDEGVEPREQRPRVVKAERRVPAAVGVAPQDGG